MMIWLRAPRDLPCGGCGIGAPMIHRGDPMLEIEITEPVLTKRVRCRTCAKHSFNEEPPADLPALPPLVVPAPITRRPGFVSTLKLGQSVRWNDVRQRQTGDRE